MASTQDPDTQIPSFKSIPSATTLEYAQSLDASDPLRHLRTEFHIPSKADLKRRTLSKPDQEEPDTSEPCIYLCGNSLGLQPRRTRDYIQAHLETWATKGVYGHFVGLDDSPLPAFLHADDAAARAMAEVVGARQGEVAVMLTLTANLHLMMASFYKPTEERWKVVIEGGAFPSDHYAVESQLRHHGLDPASSLVLLEPSNHPLSAAHILETIEAHASTAALLLLPGIQYYTGQYLDVAAITSFAQARGIVVGWDLAHAVGNVELRLHDWNVDFAVWCNYKYMNGGPGVIGGLFVHERHGEVDLGALRRGEGTGYRRRLAGWWGARKEARFEMGSDFIPIPGAAGYQLSNPSILDMASLCASLSLFQKATMPALRKKSIGLTAYLEHLLLLPSTQHHQDPSSSAQPPQPYEILTPSNPLERGAQLSIRFRDPRMLARAMKALEDRGVVVDERKPDVVRVAPAPMYNSFEDVWRFWRCWVEAVEEAAGREEVEQGDGGEGGQGQDGGAGGGGVMVEAGREERGWSVVK